MLYLGDCQELGDDFHVGDELLVDLQCRSALLARHLEELRYTRRQHTISFASFHVYYCSDVSVSKYFKV